MSIVQIASNNFEEKLQNADAACSLGAGKFFSSILVENMIGPDRISKLNLKINTKPE